MVREIVVITLCGLLLAGCGKKHQPTRREVSDKANPAPAHTGMSGMPKGMSGMPKGMSGMPKDAAHAGMSANMPQATIDNPKVSLGSMHLTAPDGWVRKQPRSRITLAEFTLPRVEPDAADGRLTITRVGGSVEANVERWKQQFAGKPKQESKEQVEIAGVQVTTIDLSGTYNDQHGMSQAVAAQLSDYRMRAAVFSIQGQQFIIKCYGPVKTMADNEDAFMAFLKSLSLPKPEADKGESKEPSKPS